VRITWDEPKRISNVDNHGVDFAAIGGSFFDEAVIQRAKGGRWKALGRLGGVVVAVIFKPLGVEGLAIISARAASRKERRFVND
jgi:uncharacterized protein